MDRSEKLFEYFSFELVKNNTYGIKAKDERKIPKKLVIPSEYNKIPVTEILNGAFQECEITEVTIPNSIIRIGEFAFCDCDCLTKVTMGDGVLIISEGAFINCLELKKIDIGNNVKIISKGAFFNSGIENAYIPMRTEKIETGAFYQCENLSSIIVSKKNIQYSSIDGNLYSKDGKVLIQYAIGNTQSTFLVPNGVNEISENAFSQCSLNILIIPESVKKINASAFDECDFLKIYCRASNKPNGWNCNLSKCLVFYSSTDEMIESLIGNETTIDGIKYKLNHNNAIVICLTKDVKVLKIPSNITYLNKTYLVDTIEQKAFYNCKTVTSVEISEGVVDIGEQAFAGCEELISIILPNSVVNIGELAFAGCVNIQNINIPASVREIGKAAFLNCANLQKITVSNNNKYFKVIDGSLYNKNGSTLLRYAHSASFFEIPNDVTTIASGAFYGCNHVLNIAIPSGVSIIEDIALNCLGLKYITVNLSNKKYKDINGSLYSKDGKILIQCNPQRSDQKFVIPKGVIEIANYAFLDCKLSTIIMPNDLKRIGTHAFCFCEKIKNIEIPNSVKTIGEEAFYGCEELTNIKIPNGVGIPNLHPLKNNGVF